MSIYGHSRGNNGMGGQGRLSGNREVARVERVVRAPGGTDRRVDVVLKKNRDGWDKERASIYISNKTARKADLTKGKEYIFELSDRMQDMDRGQGVGRSGSFGKSRDTYRCDTIPQAYSLRDGRLDRFSDGSKVNKWHNSGTPGKSKR